MATLVLPIALDFVGLLDAASGLADSGDETLTLDFSQLQFVEPSGLVALAAMIEREISNNKGVTLQNAPQCIPFEYLQRMDFFKHFGVFQDEGFSRKPVTDRFVALQEIRTNSNAKEIATRLSNTISGSELILNDLHSSLYEGINNIIDHSRATGFTVAQSYKCRNGDRRYSMAIADAGIGIRKSLSKNRSLSIQDDQDALDQSCQSGVTGAKGIKNEFGGPRNVGQGLFQIDRITESTNGVFSLVSGQAWRRRGAGRVSWRRSLDWDGTIIVLNLTRNRINQYAARHQRESSSELRIG